MLAHGISTLTREKELEVRTSENARRKNSVQIQDDDIILRSSQRIFLPLARR
jgi:hypothetical protein